MEGAIYVPETYEGRTPDAESVDRADMVQRLSTLTPQQPRVLQMLRQGLLNKQIACELQVAKPRSRRMSRKSCASSMSKAACNGAWS